MIPPLDPEYHSARLLLLIDAVSHRSDALDGLTKLAKLDFLIRYPDMLRRLLVADDVDIADVEGTDVLPTSEPVESRMIRYKYGPWDDLYYPIVGALLSRGLVEPAEGRGRVSLRPSPLGREVATALRRDDAWAGIARRCDLVATHYNMSGNALKNRIYADLPEAVDLPLREVI